MAASIQLELVFTVRRLTERKFAPLGVCSQQASSPLAKPPSRPTTSCSVAIADRHMEDFKVALPPLDVESIDQSHASVHRLRRVRRNVDGLTRISLEVDELSAGTRKGQQPAHNLPARLSELILANCHDDLQFESALKGYSTGEKQITASVASSTIKRLCTDGHVQEGLAFFHWLQARGFVLQRSALTALVAAIARSGPYAEAEVVFSAMMSAGLEPSLHALTALMQARAQAGKWREVLSVFRMLQDAGFKPDTMIYNCAIGSCGRAGQTHEVQKLWNEMQDDGCNPNTGTMALLLSTFIGANMCDNALEVFFQANFLRLPITKDMYKGMICLLAKLDRWPFALEIYREAISKAMACDPALRKIYCFSSPVTFNALVSSLSRAGEWQGALNIYGDMCAFDVRPDQFTWCALASALGRAGEYGKAFEMNKEMSGRWGLKPNLEVCNATLLACQQKGRWERALQLLWQMETSGIEPDVVSYSTAIRACELASQPAVALRIYRHMLRVPCTPNSYTYGSLIRTLGRSKDWKGALHIYEDMSLSGQIPNIHVQNALLLALLECKRYEEAYMHVEKMKRYRLPMNSQTQHLLKKYGLQYSL